MKKKKQTGKKETTKQKKEKKSFLKTYLQSVMINFEEGYRYIETIKQPDAGTNK
ncbi:MAG: hypothetical protein K1X81_04645 [Bacteroidia bacterium]|nr:hypothetical protein [Bacteroidia bacterium]